jgi:murein DD-endopeptidase MepM/ murein hydrolase activator NlpD
MPNYCAIPPIDLTVGAIGRGFGVGFNRSKTAADQNHAGIDFVVDRNSPILATLPGRVVIKSTDTGPNVSAPGPGQVRGMGGYGNAIVLQHNFNVPGLPNPFWTLHAHMVRPSPLNVGDQVQPGTLIGNVGNTTNGRFRGMGAHLHFEVRVRMPPGSYDRDTVDPTVLFQAVGYQREGAVHESARIDGRTVVLPRLNRGELELVRGGPSDCSLGQRSTVSGVSVADFAAETAKGTTTGTSTVGSGQKVDKAVLKPVYQSKGTTTLTVDPHSEEFSPPDYASTVSQGSGVSTNTLIIAGAAGVAAFFILPRVLRG